MNAEEVKEKYDYTMLEDVEIAIKEGIVYLKNRLESEETPEMKEFILRKIEDLEEISNIFNAQFREPKAVYIKIADN